MDTPAGHHGLIMTTAANRDDAEKIARALIGEKLAACVQLLPIESFYTWEGALANDAELLLLIKTKKSLFGAAMAAIKAIHTYETPEIVALDFAGGSAGYFAWIDQVTR